MKNLRTLKVHIKSQDEFTSHQSQGNTLIQWLQQHLPLIRVIYNES